MLSIFITNLGKYNEGHLLGEWLALPCEQDKLEVTLNNIGINKNYEEWFITDYSCEFKCVCNVIMEYSNINSLNKLAQRLSEMEQYELDKLEAISEYENQMDISTLLNITYNLDCFNVYPDVKTQDDLGEYYFYELSAIEIPEHLICYFDFKAFGRDIDIEGTGMFTSIGYVEQVDDVVDRIEE